MGFMSGLTTPIIICILSVIYFVQEFHIPRCEQLQQIKQRNEEYLVDHHAEAANAIEYIRVSKQQAAAETQGFILLDKSQASFYHNLDAKRWIDCVLDMISSGIMLAIAVLGVFLGPKSAVTTGLAILIVASISYKLGLAITFFTDLKTLLPSLNYTLEFITEKTAEALEVQRAGDFAPPRLMPEAVELQRVTATHRYGLIIFQLNSAHGFRLLYISLLSNVAMESTDVATD